MGFTPVSSRSGHIDMGWIVRLTNELQDCSKTIPHNKLNQPTCRLFDEVFRLTPRRSTHRGNAGRPAINHCAPQPGGRKKRSHDTVCRRGIPALHPRQVVLTTDFLTY